MECHIQSSPAGIRLRCMLAPLRWLSIEARCVWLIVALVLTLSGCTVIPFEQGTFPVPSVGSAAPASPEAASTPRTGRFLIGVTDELDIKFPDRPDLNELVRVRPDGKISLRLINSIQADGRSPEELQAEIARRYRELTMPVGSPTGSAAEKRYVIGAGDELEIKFPYHQGYDQAVKVRPDGKISLNLVKTIQAEGKTPEELEIELNQRYQAFLKRPDLVVIVRNFASNRVFVGETSVPAGLEDLRPVVIVRSFSPPQLFVGGEVARPGVLAYRSNMTLLSSIIESGGTKPGAQIATVLVLRRTGPAQAVVVRRDLRPDQQGSDTNDIYLEPFDIVFVPKTPIAQVGEFMEQLFGILPPLKNSSFGFVYQLNKIESSVVVR